MNAGKESLAPDSTALLRQVLTAVGPAKPRQMFEIACVIVLTGAVNSPGAVQWRAFNAPMFIAFMEAKLEASSALEAFLLQRFRPETRPSVDAWLKPARCGRPAGSQCFHAIGRDQGGLSAKLTALVDGRGRALQARIDPGPSAASRSPGKSRRLPARSGARTRAVIGNAGIRGFPVSSSFPDMTATT